LDYKLDSDVDIVKNGILLVMGQHKSICSLALWTLWWLLPSIRNWQNLWYSSGCVLSIHRNIIRTWFWRVWC